MQDDLFGQLATDAGKGHDKSLRCSQCGNPLVGTARSQGMCLACAWQGQPVQPFVPSPGDLQALGAYVPHTTPYAHQLAAVRGLQGSVRALLMEMGTGKTKVIIDDWAMRVLNGEVKDLVVVAPMGVYRNWEGVRAGGSVGELGVHLPRDLLDRTLVATWRSGGGVGWRQHMQAVLSSTDPRRPRVLLVNAEALAVVPKCEQYVLDFISSARRRLIMVVDESTLMRSHDAIRTGVLVRVGAAVARQHKRIATGLPTPRSPLDLWGQFEFLDPYIMNCDYRIFEIRYAVHRTMGVTRTLADGTQVIRNQKVVVGYRNVPELKQRIAPYSFRVLKEQCLDLPPKVYETRDVELTAEQTRVYGELVAQATSQLAGGEWVTATEVLPRLIRLQQVLCGFVVDELGAEHGVESRRLGQLLEVLQECSGKAIVWAPYRRSLAEIAAALRKAWGPESTVEYWGNTPPAQRVQSVERFQHDSACRWFVANQAVGGLGITLTAAQLMVYYANTPNLEHRMQSEDRAHRRGLRHPVTYVDLIARGTLDEKWVDTLRRKLDLASVITGDAYRRWLV